MEKAAVVEDGGTDRISDLPEEILHNILYYVPIEEEAARTCVLSKSWRYVWRGRLRISYNEGSPLYNGPDSTESFISDVSKALQSHLDHNNHHINKFRLVVTSSESVPLVAEKWIPMLTAIGVKVLLLSIIPVGSRKYPTSYVDLPSSVFVEPAKSLKILQLSRCNLGGGPPIMTTCSFDRLKKLSLKYVKFTDGDQHIFDKIFSSCPLITLMILEECTGLKTIKLLGDDDDNKKLHHKHLKRFTFCNHLVHRNDECSIEIHATPTLAIIDVYGSKIRFHGHKFGNLKFLSLSALIFSGDSFDCRSCYEFPCLEKLHISDCDGWGHFGGQLMRINAPKMLYLEYQGWCSNPPITFTTPISRECKSDITLMFEFADDLSWFLEPLELSEFLRHEISPSDEIRLVVHHNPLHINTLHLDIDKYFINPPVVVEELGLNMGHIPSFPSYLSVMLRICRPRYITPHKFLALPGRDKEELTEFFCRNQEFFTRHQDFEEFSVESFDTSLEQWQPVMMSECASLPESNPIRFRLKWSTEAAAATCDSSSKSF